MADGSGGQETIAPGWYHDGQALRWWDGASWGPYAPAAAWSDPRSDEAGKTLATLAHLGCLVGGFPVPLVIYLTQKDKNPFVRHHAREALNYQLTALLAALIAMGVFFGTMIASLPDVADQAGAGPPWPIFVVFTLSFAVIIANWAFGITGAVKASKLERWRYPLSIRFVRPGPDEHQR